jgi:uncharacterized protein
MPPTNAWLDVYPDLVEEVLQKSNRRHSVDHGEHHWQLVAVTGAELIAETPAVDPHVVFLFALFHDSKRENEYVDPGHGRRAGRLAQELLAERDLIDEYQLEQLVHACKHHTGARISDDPTIGTCWDSDRLNLWRVAIEPDPVLLSTEAARSPDRIQWADDLQDRNFSWAEICELYASVTSI